MRVGRFGAPAARLYPRAAAKRLCIAVALAVSGSPASGTDGAIADFSPDGKSLVYSGSKGLEILSLDSAGGALIPRSENAVAPLFSPNGRYVAFCSGVSLPMCRLDLFDTRTGRTRTVASHASPPIAWREDSARIAFVRSEEPGGDTLVEYDLRESEATHETRLPAKPNPNNEALTWIPDTDALVYLGESKSGHDVFLAEQGEVKAVTSTGSVTGFRLAADGRSLLFAQRSRNPRYILLSLYRFDLKTRSVDRLPFPDRVPGINPDPRTGPSSVEAVIFSPDGSRLVLFCRMGRPPAKPSTIQEETLAIYSAPVTGASSAKIWTSPRKPSDERLRFAYPFWARDSKRLGLYALSGKTGKILEMAPDGSSRSQLAAFAILPK